MFSFKGFQTQEKNTHLEHLEDDIINRGATGGENAVNFLKAVRNMLAGSGKGTNMTVKWDGAPAIICGVNPENGKFFVGTKSVFNKTPKINYNLSDIRKNHTGAVADKLSICIRYLSRLPIKGILQGDLLFTQDDKKGVTIDGEKMISFTPNTITYAVPVDSGIGRQIARAKMGIVFHTKYTGKTLDSMTAGFGTVRGRATNVFLASAGYRDVSGQVKLTRSELTQFNARLRMAEGSLMKAGPLLDEMSKSSADGLSVGFRLKTFFNHYIRNTQGHMAKVRQLVDMFREYYVNILQAEIDARKTAAGKQKYKDMMKTNVRYIDRNKNALVMAIASHVTLQNAKNFLINKMSEIQSVGHFLRTSTGYKVTAPEGYVAVDKVAGAVKLVDRLEFSRANFTMPKGWS
mgnify:CR=1 FL=1